MKIITVQEVQSQLNEPQKLTVVDIRETYERDICVIESMHIPMAEIGERVTELPKSDKIAIMCKSGKRAAATVNFLEKDYNVQNLYILDGGIMSWIENIDQTLEAY